MFRYLIRRILWAIFLFLIITFVTFVIFFMAPNDPARAMCGGDQASRQCLLTATEKLGLDKPVLVQYFKYLDRLVVHQDLGTSYATGQSINQKIKKAAPVTASLVFGGAVLWMMIGLSVGIYSALRPRSLIDRAAMVFVLIGVSAHPVWIGLILSYVFGVRWHITPIADYANFFGAAPGSGDPGGPGAVGLPHDLALDDVRAPVRGALRPHDQGQRDGDPERGLRAHRAGQGSARTADPVRARASKRAAAGRDDARHGHRRRTRRRDLHRDRVPASGARAERWSVALGNEDLATSRAWSCSRRSRFSSST